MINRCFHIGLGYHYISDLQFIVFFRYTEYIMLIIDIIKIKGDQ